ncbi:uncharacterized protein LOC128930282 isoform X3 [Callithrix jacchus]
MEIAREKRTEIVTAPGNGNESRMEGSEALILGDIMESPQTLLEEIRLLSTELFGVGGRRDALLIREAQIFLPVMQPGTGSGASCASLYHRLHHDSHWDL